MRTYYCECGGIVETIKNVVGECKCGKLFGYNFKTSNHVNMRSTWSGQTKVELSSMTIDEDIKQRNNR